MVFLMLDDLMSADLILNDGFFGLLDDEVVVNIFGSIFNLILY